MEKIIKLFVGEALRLWDMFEFIHHTPLMLFAAAGKWKLYESAKLAIANGEVDFNDDAFEIALFLSNSNADTLTLATIGNLSDLTNQHASANGYTQADGAAGGKVLAVTATNTAGTITVDGDDPVWTASGGSIVARFAVIIDGTHAQNLPIAVCKLDSADADVTATTGNTLTITQNVSGMFTLSGAATN